MKSFLFRIPSRIGLVTARLFSLFSVVLASAVLLGLAARPSQAAVLLSENFDASDGGFTVNTPIAYDGPWVYSAGTGSWTEAGQNPENGHQNNSTLISPAIVVPQAGEVQLTFSHRYSFEAGQWDGGQVRISVNGGAFTAVPAANFTQNGYNGTVLPNSQSSLAGQSAFTENSPDFGNTKVTSIATLGSFKAGDSIQVAFLAANDTNTRGQFQPNWEIDSITVTSLSTVTLPTMSCPTNIVAECTGGLTPVSFTVTASDASGPVAVISTPPSGSGFRLGTTNVVSIASNAAGTNSCTFTVTVVDTTPPQVTCPSNIVTTATGPGGAAVTYTASASDSCGIASFNSSPNSGSTFPIGTTTVTATATDSSGNSNACSFTVTVTAASPTLNCPTNIVAECTGGLTPVNFTVTASDASGPVAVTSIPPSGSGFPLGTTNVVATAANSAGTNSCTFTVTVVDTTPPQVTCPSNIVTAATGPGGAVVTYTASASDSCGIANFNSSPSSGSTFPIGTTTVISTATDSTGNSNSCSFTITVTPTNTAALPVLNCPTNVVAECTGGLTPVSFTVTASDASGPVAVTSTPASGSGFPLGTTNVIATASNAAGTNSCTFTVMVVDTTPPLVTCPSNIITTATGPGGAVVTYIASASDLCGVASFNSSPSSGSTFPVGTTTVISTATDSTGNSNSCSFTVMVTATNGCPVASSSSVSVNTNGQVSFQLGATDPDGNALQFQVTQPPTHGTLVLEGQTGAATYSPNQDYCGPDSFRFRASDGQCNSADATISITVNCPNQCPTAVPVVTPTLSTSCVGVSNVVVAADNIVACVGLDGNGSSDPDPGTTLTYSWTVDGRFNVSMDGSQDGGGARKGAGVGTVTLAGNTLTIDIAFSGLSAEATAAHIHGPAAPGVNAAVLYPLNSITTLGKTAGTIKGTVTLVDGTGGFTVAQQLQQLRDGNWYINIHDATFPGGEIRGQVRATAQGATINNCLPIGSHEVCLTVSDGRCSDTKCVTVEVISPCQAIGTLVIGIESSTLPRNRQQPLTAVLKTACSAFERGGLTQGINHLERFQSKVHSQVEPVDAALAQQLIDCAQSIINSLSAP